MTAPSILFVLTNCEQLGDTGRKTGYFLSEVTHPARVLSDAGCEIRFASPRGGQPPVDPASRDREDGDNRWFLADENWLSRIAGSARPEDLEADDFQAILFAGGHGAMWDLADNQALAKLTGSIWEQGGVVAAVCHGPAGLVNVELADGSYLVDGRQLTAFTNDEEAAVELDDVVPFLLESRLRKRGADFSKADPFQEHIVTDGRLVTGQNPASARGVGKAMAKLLEAGE